MAVCGLLASLPALHLSTGMCACVSGAVCAHNTCVQCNSAPCDLLGVGALWLPDAHCCGKSVGTGEAGGCDKLARHPPRTREPFRDSERMDAQRSRTQHEQGLECPKPNPPVATTLFSSPPLPHFLKPLLDVCSLAAPQEGFPVRTLQQRPL